MNESVETAEHGHSYNLSSLILHYADTR